MHIFLADDDEDDRFFFKEAFKKIDSVINVLTFGNGMQLMDHLLSDENEVPDLVFLDLNMPGKGGVQILQEIRNNDKHKNTPVAIYSTSSRRQEIELAYNNGANIYIKKPNDFHLLIKALGKAIDMDLGNFDGLEMDDFLLNV